ncbi:hypothetical protein DPMN_015306 [Dreissena polymorpha]|uniref:Uncharacterized protein n=1 Tax=Dreissena polymorpha TaxID=45954 RepID=A0A9D4NAU4_DREPO|nr:hypothetical protein DPMN_015306 [Dreissena polymorpha]
MRPEALGINKNRAVLANIRKLENSSVDCKSLGQIVQRTDCFNQNGFIREKNAPPLGSHVFQAQFHEDRKINVASRLLTRKNAPPPGSHVFQPTGIIFYLVQEIIGMNLLTKFHEEQTINVASRLLTRFYYSHIWKNALPLSSHVFQANVTIFELIQDIIETNLPNFMKIGQ